MHFLHSVRDYGITFSYSKFSIEEVGEPDCEVITVKALRATRDQLSPWSSPSTCGRGVFHLHNSVEGTTYRSDPHCAAMTAKHTEHPSPPSPFPKPTRRLLGVLPISSRAAYSCNTNHTVLTSTCVAFTVCKRSTSKPSLPSIVLPSQPQQPTRSNCLPASYYSSWADVLLGDSQLPGRTCYHTTNRDHFLRCYGGNEAINHRAEPAFP